jgi:YVTN family beta-propeller protein
MVDAEALVIVNVIGRAAAKTDNEASETPGTVLVIDPASNTLATTIPIGGSPIGLVVPPDGRRVYATDIDGTIAVIDTANNTVTATISPGGTPYGVAINPDGSKVYAANITSN